MVVKNMNFLSSLGIGRRIYFSVLSAFVLFAAAFILFQQNREKQYKIDNLNLRLQDYNLRMHDWMQVAQHPNEQALDRYVATHALNELRVTIIDRNGHVLYDNRKKNYTQLPNHLTRPEVKAAVLQGWGSTVERNSATLGTYFFYSATRFSHDNSLIIRSALPYDNNLVESLKADQHYLWFALSIMLLLVVVLYPLISRLGDNIFKLRAFATRADHGESLDTEDLAEFPSDELGEIAEKIVKIYKRLQSTRREQDILKRQLTQNIAHELKTPVASIQGYLETILSNPNINAATQQQFLERSYAQTQRLTSLLQDISTLNRLDDAPELTQFDSVNISQLVQNIVRETALQLQEKQMTFLNHLPEGIVVHGNQSLLYSVFRNLTDNAIAYAGQGRTITLSATDDATHYTFRFADNGNGVPAQHLPRIFERFYRVDKGRSRKMGGTGLGLAIVKNAVLLHKGTISVQNQPEGGLLFIFTIAKN